MRVDLPLPFAPRMATCSPEWTVRFSWFKAKREPRCTETFSNSSKGDAKIKGKGSRRMFVMGDL